MVVSRLSPSFNINFNMVGYYTTHAKTLLNCLNPGLKGLFAICTWDMKMGFTYVKVAYVKFTYVRFTRVKHNTMFI